MGNSQFIKRLIPILLSTFVAWFYVAAYTPLGYIYNTYPGQDALVMSIATIPGVVAMIGGFVSAAIIRFVGRKPLILGSMGLMLAGGLLVRFMGNQNIYTAIVGSAMTGFAAGSIPTANISALSAITPTNLSDKIYGLNDATTSIGMVFANAAMGFLAASGEWVKAFDIYWVVAAAIIATVIWYPSDKVQANNEETVDSEGNDTNKISGSIIALIIFKFVAALFYMGMTVNLSSLIINELQIGTSAHVGTLTSLATFIGVVIMAAIFVVLKVCRQYSLTAMMLLTGIAFVLATHANSVITIGILFCIASIGINAQHSGITTVLGNAVKGKAAGTAVGLFTGFMFIGEALCGYVPRIISNMILGSANPSDCILISGICCIILGVIGYFIYGKAYKLAFPNKDNN